MQRDGENVKDFAPLFFRSARHEGYHQWTVMFVAIQGGDAHDFVVIYRDIVRGVTKDTG